MGSLIQQLNERFSGKSKIVISGKYLIPSLIEKLPKSECLFTGLSHLFLVIPRVCSYFLVLLVCIHQDIFLDYDQKIAIHASKYPRRMLLINLLSEN